MPDIKIVCSYGNTGANGAGKLSNEFDNLYEFEHNENYDMVPYDSWMKFLNSGILHKTERMRIKDMLEGLINDSK